MTAEAFPLEWPDGWPRTPAEKRVSGRGNFQRPNRTKGYGSVPWTFAEARDALLDELRRFDARHVVLSSNFPLGRYGYMTEAKRRPEDQGVAVYFAKGGKSYVMPMDEWAEVESNLRSLTLALEAMRQLERHGGGKMVERAFQGFVALPPPPKPHQVLGVAADATEAEVRAAWRARIGEAHPDNGGDHHSAAELNAARDAMLRALQGGQ